MSTRKEAYFCRFSPLFEETIGRKHYYQLSHSSHASQSTNSIVGKQWLIRSSFSWIPEHGCLAYSLWDRGGETGAETALTSLMKHVSVLFSASCLSHSESKPSRQESPLLGCWISFKSQESCSSSSPSVTVNTQRVFTHTCTIMHLSLDLADMHWVCSSIAYTLVGGRLPIKASNAFCQVVSGYVVCGSTSLSVDRNGGGYGPWGQSSWHRFSHSGHRQ